MLSVAGKKPSDAKIASLAESTTLIKAISTAPTLLVWPPQIPIVFKSFAITIAFDFKCFAILYAKTISSIISGVGFSFVTVLKVSGSNSFLSVS